MFYDFNIPYQPNADRASVDKLKLILSRISQLEPSVVALNQVIVNDKFHKINPISFDPVPHPVTQLTRVTAEFDLSNDTVAELRSHFDLVAVRPTTAETFVNACTTLDIDLISLDCSQRVPFHIDPLHIQEAIRRGIYFEICYASGIRDNTARIYLLQTAKQLVAYTRGQNVIISSEAQVVSEIRAPFDIANLYVIVHCLNID
ncbi:hypothetical protein DFQ28_005222 [Apophysomyces sp. BC1034]|nr:hypothetical protein DFQ30_005094 [Apophysomyces sp. BC1015]KAG0177889.1 hypothetical protein DFQ29_004198 [Apophysomyces sp. BC1021]KAG0188212.1 hypothetical protein DFQ28_005222 [Apophysomyces sp. BC1034]